MDSACPNCAAEDPTPHSMPVDIETYVEHAAQKWPEAYTGVLDATPVQEDGSYGLNIHVDQDSYGTPNFFEHRHTYENQSTIDVTDLKPEWVAIRFCDGAVRTITAFHCRECPTVWDPNIGEISPVSTTVP